jgi:hypothetical protein
MAMLKLIEKLAPDIAFDPETVRVLADAFDAAWRSLETSGAPSATDRYAERARAILATSIIEAAKRGERNQKRLREEALLRLAKSALK